MTAISPDKRAADLRYRGPALQALQAWRIEVRRLELVDVSENVTYRLHGWGDDFVLRLHRPGYHTLAELVSERIWTAALAAAGINVPHAIRSRTGQYYVAADIDAAERRWVGVARWQPGTPLETLLPDMDAASVEERFEAVGELAAKLHTQSSAWQPPAGFTRHAFDVPGYFGPAPFWGRFWECRVLNRGERALLMATVARIRKLLAALGKSAERYGMIHADLHFGNVLCASAPGGRTSLALIDFDDAGFGWHHYELAVVLARYRGDPRYRAFKTALLRGYRRERPFSRADEALIDTFVVIRWMVMLGWLDARPEFGDEARLMRHKERLCALCAEYRPP